MLSGNDVQPLIRIFISIWGGKKVKLKRKKMGDLTGEPIR